MTAERLGVPAVGVMTAGFVDGAELMARALGMDGYRFAVIEHPISSATRRGLMARAADALAQASALLLTTDNDGER